MFRDDVQIGVVRASTPIWAAEAWGQFGGLYRGEAALASIP